MGCVTVTEKVWSTVSPSGSVAVAVIVALPAAPGVRVRVALDTLTVAIVVSEEVAV